MMVRVFLAMLFMSFVDIEGARQFTADCGIGYCCAKFSGSTTGTYIAK